MILKDAANLIRTHSFLFRNNKATYTYAIGMGWNNAEERTKIVN
jgi:hypothetical protein